MYEPKLQPREMERIDFKHINVRKSYTVVLMQLSYPYNPLRLKERRFLQSVAQEQHSI